VLDLHGLRVAEAIRRTSAFLLLRGHPAVWCSNLPRGDMAATGTCLVGGRFTSDVLDGIAAVLAVRGNPHRAARLFGAAETVRQETGVEEP
jgi:hypothetical protein